MVASYCELIFPLLTSPKCDMGEVGRMIHVVEWYFKYIFCFLTAENTTFFKSIKRRFNWSNGTQKSFSASSQGQNSTWMKSIIRCFICSHGTLKSFSTRWPAQNASSVRLIMRCFKWSLGTSISFLAS